MEKSYFFTGFPGFICNQLIIEVLKGSTGGSKVYTLVLPHMITGAEKAKNAIIRNTGISPENFILVPGDITQKNLNISENTLNELQKKITHVYHLAAIYDLAVPKNVAYKVNVVGTENVNEWVSKLQLLERYTYFSTAYVAGKREGILHETELIKPAQFKNFYEETKYDAEVLVEELKNKVPVTIIRPGIVKGHSKTGETIKFDGPYFILNFLDRLKFLPFIPRLGKSGATINLVPVDYIISATAYLSTQEKSKGKTYHLTDPNPYSVSEIYEMFMLNLLRKKPQGILPLSIAKISLGFPRLRKLLGVEKEALDYFSWMGRFDCSQAQQDLEGSGIRCPDFKEGVPAMVEFYVKNKQNPAFQIKIV